MEVSKTEAERPLCTLCGKQFSQRKNLYEHMRNIHQENSNLLVSKKLITCLVCDKTENNRQQLYAHLTTVHTVTINFEKKNFSEMNGKSC